MNMTIDVENLTPDLQVMIIKLKEPLSTVDEINQWNQRVDIIADELEDVPCAKRVSYDKWQWSSIYELNRYLTYCYMRFERIENKNTNQI